MEKRRHLEKQPLSPEREALFRKAEQELQYRAKNYALKERFEDLSPDLGDVDMIDVTEIPGAHYGKENPFVGIIRRHEGRRVLGITISPKTAIWADGSTGNGFTAVYDGANALGYECVIVMPGGLPEPRYKHPKGKEVTIIKTPKEDYASGMPKKIQELVNQNKQRIKEGKKIYVPLNHAGANGDITISKMYSMPRQYLEDRGIPKEPIRAVASWGNAASADALGEFFQEHTIGSKLTVTESVAYGGGYDRFAKVKGLPSYEELFGIEPGHPALMAHFKAYGTNAPIGITMPLQERALQGNLIDDFVLFADEEVIEAYKKLNPTAEQLKNMLELANYSKLPQPLIDTYGNSTLANIAVARRYTGKGEHVVAMAYDGRNNY